MDSNHHLSGFEPAASSGCATDPSVVRGTWGGIRTLTGHVLSVLPLPSWATQASVDTVRFELTLPTFSTSFLCLLGYVSVNVLASGIEPEPSAYKAAARTSEPRQASGPDEDRTRLFRSTAGHPHQRITGPIAWAAPIKVVGADGIEPSSTVCRTAAQPLDQAPVRAGGVEPPLSSMSGWRLSVRPRAHTGGRIRTVPHDLMGVACSPELAGVAPTEGVEPSRPTFVASAPNLRRRGPGVRCGPRTRASALKERQPRLLAQSDSHWCRHGDPSGYRSRFCTLRGCRPSQ